MCVCMYAFVWVNIWKDGAKVKKKLFNNASFKIFEDIKNRKYSLT